MTLNASGPLSLGGATVGQSINLELGQAATAVASINATNFRTLAGVPSGQISISNFYGKSNFSGWFASFGVSTAQTPVYGVATGTSGQVYLRLNSNVANSNNSVIQISAAGAITFQRNNYTTGTGGYRSINVDSSNNYYVLGNNTDLREVQITKYNSSNTLQWSTFWYENYNQASFGSKPVIDSSGNVYVAVRGIITGCCYEFNPGVRRVSSTGAFNRSTNAITYATGNNSQNNDVAGVGVDSSGNIYLAAGGYYAGVSAAFIGKCNSSFALQSRVNLVVSGNLSIRPDTSVFDTANSVGYVGGQRGLVGIIFKYTTSLAISWAYTTSDTGYWSDSAIDSSGNVYFASVFTVAGTGIRALKIIKLDSSGSLQWARYLRATTLNLNTSGTSISINGTLLTVAAQLSGGTNAQNRGFVLQVPTSGAGSGTTFTNNSISWTYGSYTETLSSVSLTNGATGGTGGNSPLTDGASLTPTLATSAYTEVTTTL